MQENFLIFYKFIFNMEETQKNSSFFGEMFLTPLPV